KRAETTYEHHNYVKTIVNPRCVKMMPGPHNAIYYGDKVSIREDGAIIQLAGAGPAVSNRISINHYRYKSKEEYAAKSTRGDAIYLKPYHNADNFDVNDPIFNAVYDDRIISYRDERKKIYESKVHKFETIKEIDNRRISALVSALTPVALSAGLSSISINVAKSLLEGNMDKFLTCFAVIEDILLNDKDADFLRELSLKCLHKSLLSGNVDLWQLQLLFDELPRILKYSYPIVDDIKKDCLKFIPQVMNFYRMQSNWLPYNQLNYLLQMLQNL
ncbi:MAG: hypothetical protein IJ563_07645, partial [Selenomonadaceae bacterium]|nr:hypothetical protein [Selenomonadaceae bacterium]